MKTTLLAAAAATAALFVAAPGFAGDLYTPNGFVGADYTYDHVDVSGAGSANVNSFGVSGSTAVKLNSKLNLELDADYNHSHVSGYDYNTGGGDAHVFVRGDEGAYGVFFGGRAVDNRPVVDFGAEGARFFDKYTVVGSFKSSQTTDEYPRVHLSTINLGGRYWLNDNFQVNAGAAYDRPSIVGKYADGWNINAGGEYRFAQLPVSAYAKVEYTDLGGGWFPVKDTAVHVGVRWNFDGSLKARERAGATFAPTGPDAFERLLPTVF